MRKWFALASLVLASSAVAQDRPKPAVPMKLWRLDCGDLFMKRYGAWFSDTFQYPEGSKALVGSCYLIRHGSQYLLWDTGLSDRLIGHPKDDADQTNSLKTTVRDQLAKIGVKPEQITYVGISHFHGDHTGQAKYFPGAQLMIGKGDWDALKTSKNPWLKDPQSDLTHWLSGKGKAVAVEGDADVFEDGRVIMLAMPGHTPGHMALLVKLASGPVLLSGDEYHFTENMKNHGVPSFNTSRTDTLASHDRFDRIAANTGAKVVIQHEPADIAKLPAFPAAAE